MVDTAELIRVYGRLRTLNENQKEVSMSPPESTLIKVLKENIRDLRERLSEKDENLNDLRQQVKLITFVNEKNQEKKSLTWLWVLVAIIISVLATNLAYRIPNPF
jgi:vacuolar-type H+-ATPase subunit I/STV1